MTEILAIATIISNCIATGFCIATIRAVRSRKKQTAPTPQSKEEVKRPGEFVCRNAMRPFVLACKNFDCHAGPLLPTVEVNGPHHAAYCGGCGKFIKNLSKDEVKLWQRELQRS